MKTRLTNIKELGRYEHKDTMKAVNFKQGRNPKRGTDNIYYLEKGKRVFVADFEFYNSNSKWSKID